MIWIGFEGGGDGFCEPSRQLAIAYLSEMLNDFVFVANVADLQFLRQKMSFNLQPILPFLVA